MNPVHAQPMAVRRAATALSEIYDHVYVETVLRETIK